MAQKATVHKLQLAVADIDRGHYADYAYTLARHPSETATRMMVRVLAAAMFADSSLRFGPGLCVAEEPDLWCPGEMGAVALWIEVGEPDEKWLRKACAQADQVAVLAYGAAAPVWWRGIAARLKRFDQLRVLALTADEAHALSMLCERTMRLQCTIQDAQAWLTNGRQMVHVAPRPWYVGP